MGSTSIPSRTSANNRKVTKRRRKKNRFLRFMRRLFIVMIFLGAIGGLWLFLTPSGNNMRLLMADTLITTQHRHWAKYVIGQQELDKRVATYQACPHLNMESVTYQQPFLCSNTLNWWTCPTFGKDYDRKILMQGRSRVGIYP